MMINRHNYEEFFLLYADDELSRWQRAEVELFVQQNPDMAAELEMIVQMKLEPDENIVFPDKEMLFKTTDIEINLHNYEDFFLLYLDRELDEAARRKVEKFVLQHPPLQDAFTLLKQTVLQPEAITFANKSVLYRKEERRVAYIGFARLAAAAAFIGLVLLGWWMYPKTGNGITRQSVAQHSTGAQQHTGSIGTKLPVVVTPLFVTQPQTKAIAAAKGVNIPNKVQTPGVTQKAGNEEQQQPISQPKVDEPLVALNPIKQSNSQGLQATVNPNQTETGNGSNVAMVNNEHPSNSLIEPPSKAIAETEPHKTTNQQDPLVKTPDTQLLVAQTVAYKEIDTNDDERSMYVGSLELNKDKIKGFFKRAGRLFGARPKKDTD